MKRLPEEQLKGMFARVVVPEHDAHRAAVQARMFESVTEEVTTQRQKIRRFVSQFAVPGFALAAVAVGIITIGSPALRSEFAARTNNTNSIIESIVPQELIAESIQHTFSTTDGIRHVVFHTVREDVNVDGKHPEVKEVTARTDQEYYIAPNAFTGYRQVSGSSVQTEKSYRMTILHPETESIENCQLYVNVDFMRMANQILSDGRVCKSTHIADYVGFAEKQPSLDIQDLSYNTDLDSEQMSFTTAEPIDPNNFGILIAEPSFVKYLSEFIDAQNNIAFAPIALSPLGNVSGGIADPEWNVPVNGRYKQSFAFMLDGRYAHDTLTEATQSPVRIFSEVQLQIVQLNKALLGATTVQEKQYDPKLFSAASQVFQMKFSDEWQLQSVQSLTQTPEDIEQFNARRLAVRKEIFTGNSGEAFFNYIAGGSAVFAQLHAATPRIEGTEYVYSVTQEWNADNPEAHLIETREVRIDSETRLLTAIIERYDVPEMQQSTVYTTTFETLKTTNEDPKEFFSVNRWKERAKEIIQNP